MVMNAVTLQALLFSKMTAKGWLVTITTPDGTITPTSLNDLAQVIAEAVVEHVTAAGLATIPADIVMVGCTGGPTPVVPVLNPAPIPLAIT